jgi:hypothetical protein
MYGFMAIRAIEMVKMATWKNVHKKKFQPLWNGYNWWKIGAIRVKTNYEMKAHSISFRIYDE